MFHEVLQYGVYRAGVHDESVQCVRVDMVGYFDSALAIVFAEIIFVTFLVLFGQVIVCDAFVGEFGFCFDVVERYEIVVSFHGGFVFVQIRWHAMFRLEEVIGVAVHFIAWCGGQAYDQRVEMVENILVFFEDRPVCFVHDDQVEMSRRKRRLSVGCCFGVDCTDHRLVGGEHHPGVDVVLVVAQIA